MNATEHLLVCLAEECGEVAKECSKALRFGLDDQVTLNPYGPRGTEGPTVREKINRMEHAGRREGALGADLMNFPEQQQTKLLKEAMIMTH